MTEEAAGRVLRPVVPTVVTEEALSEVVAHYLTLDEFVIDVETVGDHRINPRLNQVLWVGLAAEGRTDIIPLGHPNGELKELKRALLGSAAKRLSEGKDLRRSDVSKADSRARKVFYDPPEQLMPAVVFEALRPILYGSARKIGANIKFDLCSIAKYYGGEIPPAPHGDVIIGDFLLDDTHQHQMGLAHITKRRLGYAMPKGVGKEVEAYSFQEVARYLAGDVKFTWLLWKQIKAELEAKHLSSVMNLEMDVLDAVMAMEQVGTLVDVAALKRLREELDEGILTVTADAYRAAGKPFNVQSNADKRKMLFTPEGRNLTPKVFTTKTNEPATSEDALKAHPRDPLCKALLGLSELKKLMSTYVVPYLGGEVERTTAGKTKTVIRESLLVNGRVHTSFKQHGARTGRFSCVAGETLLHTSRGTFRFDEYVPVQGDTVLTHTGSWMPVVRKIYKGISTMYRVRNSSGGDLVATADHRLLTPSGWVRVGDLSVGDDVLSVSEREVCARREQQSEGSVSVQGRRQAHGGGTGEGVGNLIPECPVHRVAVSSCSGVRGGESPSVLTVQDGREEPHAGQEWFAAPQLQGNDFHWGRLHPVQEQWPVRAQSPGGRGTCARSREVAGGIRRSPYRREQAEQLFGQLGADDCCWSSEVASRSRVEDITALEPMGVWDIEVEGDHSYAAGGFLNHNSTNPNLQNIPSRGAYGQVIRSMFIPDPGHTLIVSDYSQIEPRVMASFSGDKTMLAAYNEGRDLYQAIADKLGVTRDAGKTLILAMAYGIGPQKISHDLEMGVRAARDLLDDFARQFPALERYKQQVIREAARRRPVPYVVTVLGRRRLLPDLASRDPEMRSKGKRQAFNTMIQGSAADIMKLAIIRAHKMIPEEARVLLTVHDELVVMSPNEIVDETVEALREAMEGVGLPQMKVPLKVDIGTGQNWSEAK